MDLLTTKSDPDSFRWNAIIRYEKKVLSWRHDTCVSWCYHGESIAGLGARFVLHHDHPLAHCLSTSLILSRLFDDMKCDVLRVKARTRQHDLSDTL